MTTQHPPGATKLIAEAKHAGRKIIEAQGRTTIKRGAHDGVIISENGCILRYGIDLTMAARMSLANARHVLQLGQKSP